MNREGILASKELLEFHRIYAISQERQEGQIRSLCLAFKETLKRDPVGMH
jgi:hypothetical protein